MRVSTFSRVPFSMSFQVGRGCLPLVITRQRLSDSLDCDPPMRFRVSSQSSATTVVADRVWAVVHRVDLIIFAHPPGHAPMIPAILRSSLPCSLESFLPASTGGWPPRERNLKKQNNEGGAARYGATYGRASPPRKQAEKQPGRFGRHQRRKQTPCLSPALPSRWRAKTAAKRELAQNARFELYSGTPANLNKIAYQPSGRRANAMKTLQHVPTAMNRDSQDTPEVRV
jgi:hypothetical protein